TRSDWHPYSGASALRHPVLRGLRGDGARDAGGDRTREWPPTFRTDRRRACVGAMKFTFGNLPSIGWEEPAGRLVELAQRAEAAGFDRFGVSDWRFYQDCFVVMTACLQATTRLEVESLVTDPYVRHPGLT